MEAITLWQPWASLLACGAKKYETRSWATSYRGKIAIHAAKKLVTDNIPNEIHNALCWKGGFNKYKVPPLGCIIATAELVECWHIVEMPGTNIDVAKHIPIGAELDVPKHHPRFHDYIVPTEKELLFGDWTPGHYAWEFKNMQMLPKPIPAKGKQRIWKWGSKAKIYDYDPNWDTLDGEDDNGAFVLRNIRYLNHDGTLQLTNGTQSCVWELEGES